MTAADGKQRETDAANPETLFRIIQSIPSPKAEPFKRWLAKVAYERIQEIQDPEIAIKRAVMSYQGQNKEAARIGGDIAGTARRTLERETGKPVVSNANFLPKRDKPSGIE